MDKMDQIKSCIADEMRRFEDSFERALSTHVPLADNVIHYFLDRRGKQMRPMVALLAAKMVGGEVTEASIKGAVSLELLHNASLMHDDVIDKSDERRGISTVNKVWDNRVAVLMGDFFLSKCLVVSNSTGSLDISNILSDMVIRLSEGELEQLSNVRSRLLSEAAYFSVISGKTASLFSACMKVGALSVGGSEALVEQMGQVGELMGLIFQIRDDILDEMFAGMHKLLNNRDSGTNEQILDMMMIAKYYERIGDHATNVAEWVGFMMNGIHQNGDESFDIFNLGKDSKNIWLR